MADFYYRYNNASSNMILNDAYLGSINPVTSGLHRRFKASDFNATTKIWTDSVTGTTITATGNISTVTNIGNKQFRPTNAVQFNTTGRALFNNDILPSYTLFTITRYSGTNKGRIIQKTIAGSTNFLSGHWGGKSGVAHHDNWVTSYLNDVHGNNFFIGTDVSATYTTNGIERATTTLAVSSSLPLLEINTLESEPSDGQLLDLLMYNRVLTDLEKKKVEQYLASYYGLMDLSGNLTANYFRTPTASETSLLVSTFASKNYITLPAFNIAQTGLTFAMWFRMNGLQDNVRLMDFGNGQSMDNIILASHTSGGLQLSLYNSVVGTIGFGNAYSTNCTDNVWRHVIWTISADGLIWKIYINRTLVTTINSTNFNSYSGTLMAPYHPTSVLRTKNYIGQDNFGGNSTLNGSIDDFQMYNYPLDQTAINQTWNMDTGGSLIPKYARPRLSSETSMLVSSAANTNYIIYPAFYTAQTGLTFAMWFRSNGTVDWGRIIDFGNGPSQNNIFIAIRSNNLVISHYTTTIQCELRNVYSNCNDNVWRHLVWTISADGLTWKVYINKVLQATITSSNYTNYETPFNIPPAHPSSVLRSSNYIGKSNWSADPVFNGSVHAFQMWNSPLDQNAVSALYTDTAFAGTYTLSRFPNRQVYFGSSTFMLDNPLSTGSGTFSFTSSNPAVATIEDNMVTVLSVGKTTITATQWTTSITCTLTVVLNTVPDFYYRAKNSMSNMLLNDAYLLSPNPVTGGLHRRFKASDFNAVTKVWTDSVTGTTVTATGNISLVQHSGDKQYRTTNAVQFTYSDGVAFNNEVLNSYTLFTITRYNGTRRGRVVDGNPENFISGHHSDYTGISYKSGWLSTPDQGYTTNFFIGTDTFAEYKTNGIVRRDASPVYYLTYLPQLTINAGYASPSQNSDCQALDILIYNRVLNDTDKKKVEHYLASYYGLMDTNGNLTATYYRTPLPTETSLLVSTTANPNWIVYPSFTIQKTGLTFAMWFKANNTPDWSRLFDFGTGLGSSQTYGIMVCIINSNLSLTVTTNSSVLCQLSNVYSNCNNNIWRHLVWTISADGLTWNIYINRILQATITNANKATYSPSGASTTGPYHPASVLRDSNWIGKSTWNSDPVFNGAIDEFNMYNYPLDQTAINALYTVNTVSSLSVNLEAGTLTNPLSGTSFVSSNTTVATVSGTTITLVAAGITTITSNLHSPANPFQLVLTVSRVGTNFISGQNDLIEKMEKNMIQNLVIKPTIPCQTLSLNSKNLYKKHLQVSLDGVSNLGDTTLTFGKPKPNLWVGVGSGTNTLAYSTDGIVWNSLGISIFSDQGRAVSYNGRIWLAGGYGSSMTNTLAYSYDGINWIGLGKTIFTTGCFCFAWNGRMWIAGGMGTNTLAYSYDGLNWTGLGVSIFSDWGGKIVWNGRMFVATGSQTNSLAYSYDGLNWSGLGTSKFTTWAIGLAWNGRMWVAGGSGTNGVAYSYDGLNWTGLGNTIMSECRGVAWNGSIFVITGQGSGHTLAYSYDGIVWNGLGSSVITELGLSVRWNGQMFMASGQITNTLAYSYDGINWTGLGKSMFSMQGWDIASNTAYENSITVRKRMTIAGCDGANTMAYSYDGITWTGLGKSIFSTWCNPIIWNGKMWVAGGSGINGLAYSYDGINWIGRGTNIISDSPSVGWNGTMWVAGGFVNDTSTTSSLAYSYDGITWTGSGKSTFSKSCLGIATNGKRWVAVGDGINSIAYSDNGITWTGLGRTIFDGGVFGGMAVASNGTMFIAGSYNGSNMIAYSYDGIIWIGLGFSAPPCHGIATNGTMWVTTGLNKMGYSYDGKTWFETTSTFWSEGLSVTWNGSLWIAGGYGNSKVAYSYDGIVWNPVNNAVFNTVWGIGSDWTGETTSIQLYQPIVASGDGNNTLAYSYDGIAWTGLGKTMFDIRGLGVVYNGTLWLAGGIGSVNTLAYSYDGINWTGLGNSIFQVNCSVIYNINTLWLAGGFVNETTGLHTLAYSYDGINWTGLGKAIFTTSCETISYNGSIWLAGGYGTNTLAYSSDGITWTGNSNTPFAEVCYGLAWNGTVWVAAGEGGLAYSYDGIRWTRAISGITRSRWVIWNGTTFAAIGDPYNVVAYSTDGIFWTTVTYDSFNGQPRSICWTGDKWIIFGNSNPTMKYSFDGIKWINTTSTLFINAFVCAVSDGRLPDTLNIATDSYYQSGYKSITLSTNQSS